MISVCMATYNGEKYIEEQIDSVLKQISIKDELIVSDDGSEDSTVSIIKSYQEKFNNVFLYDGPKKGIVANYSFLFTKAKGDYVFICDQDDVWCNDKVDIIKKMIEEHPDKQVFLHDAFKLCDNKRLKKDTIFKDRKAKHGVIKNLLYSTYYGCCMVIKREYLEKVLPIPKGNLYDQYIGNCAEADKCSMFINIPLIHHRENENNWSQKQVFFSRINYRVSHLNGIMKYLIRK